MRKRSRRISPVAIIESIRNMAAGFKRNIIALGSYLPAEICTNFDLGADNQWVHENLGILERRLAAKHETVAYMGMRAAEQALFRAGIKPAEINAVIVSTSSTSHNAPSIACQIINMMGIQVPAFDINAVCSGFIYGLEVACSLPYDKVLLIATEKYSAITDWDSRDCVYFGDGAGAVVVAHGTGTIETSLFADGKSGDAFVSEVGKKYTIKGRKVYDKAMEVLPDMIRGYKGFTVIPHQAGLVLIRYLMAAAKVDNYVTVMDRYANLASASIPIAMAETEDVLNKPLVLVAIGSGWTWGTAIIRP